jgi:hypothetical protein
VQCRLVPEPGRPERWAEREEDAVARPVPPGTQITIAEIAQTTVADNEPFPFPGSSRAGAAYDSVRSTAFTRSDGRLVSVKAAGYPSGN